MTDYYTNFCFGIKVSKAQAEWLNGELKRRYDLDPEEPNWLSCEYQFSEEKDEVTFTDADGQTNVDAMIKLMGDFQRKFKLKTFISFGWAFTASRARIGAYGGGAVVLRYGIPSYMNTYEWIQKKTRSRT